MSWITQIVKAGLEGNTLDMKDAFEKEMEERISDKMDDLYQDVADELFAESEELDERRRGAPKMGVDPLRHMTAAGEKERRSAAQASSKWRVTFKTKHKPVEVTARNTSEAIRKATASAEKQDVPGSAAYDDVKKIG